MLDIEITPEKSISSEKWQIILGIFDLQNKLY